MKKLIRKHQQGGFVDPIYKARPVKGPTIEATDPHKDWSEEEKYLNTLSYYANNEPSYILGKNGEQARSWLYGKDRADIIEKAYLTSGVTDRAKMPLVPDTYWQKHPVGGKDFMKETNQLHKLVTYPMVGMAASEVAPYVLHQAIPTSVRSAVQLGLDGILGYAGSTLFNKLINYSTGLNTWGEYLAEVTNRPDNKNIYELTNPYGLLSLGASRYLGHTTNWDNFLKNEIPKGNVPDIYKSLLPKRNKFGIYSKKDKQKISEAKHTERFLLYEDSPEHVDFFYKNGKDYTIESPTKTTINKLNDEITPRLMESRPEHEESIKNIPENLSNIKVLKLSDNFLRDYNIYNNVDATGYSFNNLPIIAFGKRFMKDNTLEHELRHQVQHFVPTNEIDKDILRKAYGNYKADLGYPTSDEWETMNLDARAAILKWHRKKNPYVSTKDIETQNKIIDEMSDKDFIQVISTGDGYLGQYVKQLLQTYSKKIPSEVIKNIKEAVKKVGIFTLPILNTLPNKPNND